MTFFETSGQSRVFLLLVYAGFGVGLLYDAAKGLRRISARWLRPLWDVLWCLIVGGACAVALALGGEYMLRLYALLGLCCGAGMYGLGLRRAVREMWAWAKKRKQSKT